MQKERKDTTMNDSHPSLIYEISWSLRVAWQAHSISKTSTLIMLDIYVQYLLEFQPLPS
jgi:hypothetical protein